MHPDPPHAGLGRQHRGGQRRGVPLLGRRGPCRRGRRAACRGTSCGRPRPAPAGPAPTSRSRPASSAQLCSARLANPRPGSSTSCSGATPAATTSSTRAVSSAQTSVTTSPYRAAAYISRLCPRQCMSTQGTPASATSSAMFLSASPPLTSLTRAAPARDRRLGDLGPGGVHAGAHAGRGQLADHRQHPPALLVGVDPVGARAGGLAADVDVVRARGMHLAGRARSPTPRRRSSRRRRTSPG